MGEPWTYPDELESQYYSYYDLPGDLRTYTLTGVALCTVKSEGKAGRWYREQLYISVELPGLPDFPPKNALKLIHWAPFFTLNSISNDGVANNAGWAVDGWTAAQQGYETLDDPLRQLVYNVSLSATATDTSSASAT